MNLLESLIGRARHDACVAQDAAMGVRVPLGNDRVASNDEPEPTWDDIRASAEAEVRAIMRSRPAVRALNRADLQLAAQFAGAEPFEVKR